MAHRVEGGGSLRVLIIEDNVDAADMLSDWLAFGGHEVFVAFDGAAGVERARAARPDVVICDIALPKMDGYEVARVLRADPQLSRLRLVALSGYADPEAVAQARAAGFDAHLAKPPKLDDLEQLLRSS